VEQGRGKIPYPQTTVPVSCFRLVHGGASLRVYQQTDMTSHSTLAYSFCGECAVHIVNASEEDTSVVRVNVACLKPEVPNPVPKRNDQVNVHSAIQRTLHSSPPPPVPSFPVSESEASTYSCTDETTTSDSVCTQVGPQQQQHDHHTYTPLRNNEYEDSKSASADDDSILQLYREPIPTIFVPSTPLSSSTTTMTASCYYSKSCTLTNPSVIAMEWPTEHESILSSDMGSPMLDLSITNLEIRLQQQQHSPLVPSHEQLHHYLRKHLRSPNETPCIPEDSDETIH
jgi:hypothetical protein